MSKLFQFNHVQKRIFTTLALLAFLGSIFYFFYLPKSEKQVNERLFRNLERIHDNVKIKLDNHYRLLETQLDAYTDPENSKASINNYIDTFKSQGFELAEIKGETLSKDITKRMQKVQRKYARSFQLVNDAKGVQFKLEVSKAGADSMYSHKSRNNVTQFIEPLLQQVYFNEFLLLDNGRVIYETFPSGFEITKNDSILEITKGVRARKLIELTIGGVKYKAFLQPISFDLNNKWLLCALIKSSAYNSLKTSLPTGIVITLIVLASLVVLCIPVLKIILMGNRQKLGFTDAASFYLSCLFIVSVITYMFIRLPVFHQNKDESVKHQIANQLDTNINSELKSICETLTEADRLYTSNKWLQMQLINISTNISDSGKFQACENFFSPNPAVNNYKATQISSKIKHPFHQIFWLDGLGNEINNWTTAGPPLLGNYANRQYFKAIQNKQAYKTDYASFFIDPVQSWTSGTFRTVISMPTKRKDTVACISADLAAVKHTITAPGYQFAIINNEGMVMYHSDATRNMQENILAETENNTVLRSMLFSRESGCFQSLYHGKMHSFFIKPLSQLPLSILVFNDNRQQSDVVLYAFCFTFFMLAILLGINMLEVLLIGALVTQSTKLKRNFKVFDTLFPNANHIKLYNLFCKYFLMAITLCIVSFVFDSFINSVFMLFISINLCSILIQKSYMDLQPDEWQFKGRRKRLWLLVVIAIVYNAVAFITSTHVWLLWLFQVILLAVGIWLLNVAKVLSVHNTGQQKLMQYLNILWPFNYLQSYSTMIMLRLILIGVLPVIFFYISAYNNEMLINTRMDQVFIIKELEQKNVHTFSNHKQEKQGDAYSYLDSLTNVKWINATTTKQNTQPCNVNDKLFALFRLQLNNNRLYNLSFCQTEDGNSDIFFRNQGQSQIAAKNGTSNPKDTINNVIQVTSTNMGLFKSPGTIASIFIFFTAALMIIALYALLKVGIRKLFSLNQTDVLKFSQLNLDTICDKKNRLIFVNGSPGSNKFSTIHTALLGKACYNDTEIGVINFIKIPDSDNDRLANYEWNNQVQKIKSGTFKIVILTHFEYANADERINRIKLNLLEDLLVNIDKANERFRIIIISTVHQIAFLDFIQKDFATTVFNNDMKRWSILLGQFVNVYLPLKENSMAMHVDEMMQKDNRCIKNIEPYQKQLLTLMADECRYTSFLDNQKLELANHILHTKSVNDPDDLILYIQNAAYLFYRQLWDTLTFEEKFIVLDMAEDGLANTTDSHHLNVLLCKRILLFKNGRLTLFNTSFRNFILTAIEKDEIHALTSHVKDTGTWSQLKTPLLLVVGVIAVFTFTSQQETYAQIIGIITMLSTFIPLLVRTSAIFNPTSKSTTT